MVIKLPKPTKADLIRGILDYWDPARAHGTPSYYPLYYNYEAEVLVQSIRKNSRVESVAKKVKEVVDKKLELEGITYRIDEENANRVAASMINAVKRMR